MSYPPPQPGYQPQPPQDHPRAVTSLVLGILGVVICAFCAPFAWKLGKQAVDEIDGSGGRLGGRGTAQAGYILGIIGTVILVVGLLFFLFLVVTGGMAAMGSATAGT